MDTAAGSSGVLNTVASYMQHNYWYDSDAKRVNVSLYVCSGLHHVHR